MGNHYFWHIYRRSKDQDIPGMQDRVWVADMGQVEGMVGTQDICKEDIEDSDKEDIYHRDGVFYMANRCDFP